MDIKIVADIEFAAVLTSDQIADALKQCWSVVENWNWQVWVETYPEEAEDGTLDRFRVAMGPTVNTHPSFLFIRFYGGARDA